MNTELGLDLSKPPLLFASSPAEMNEEETQRGNRERPECGRLERRWVLWHEFMKEHAHLDAWLRLAEQAVTSDNCTYVTYAAAKDELRKFERLRCDAGSRLVQLDGLTQRNRTLAELFHGAMRARLLGAARECGRRWDDVNAKLESIIRRLMVFVSEWEEFEAQGEELSLWLADLDVRLTEVDQLNGSTCEKLRRLQAFHECVCVNSSRVNALLQRGEALIQDSEATDAHHVENRLLELLRRCSHIYSNIARTHTRLLSMRLVFEDDWILSRASDSGCPSETLLEEEPLHDKSSPDLPATVKQVTASNAPPPAPSSPTHDHQGLEWDPSVDIGRSVSCDDGDSSYFSAGAGVCHSDGLKRRSYIGSESDVGAGVVVRAADSNPEGRSHHNCPGVFRHDGDPGRPWVTSSPNVQDCELAPYDGVRAWLGVQSLSGMSSCSRAVQTEGQVEAEEESSFCEEPKPLVFKQREHGEFRNQSSFSSGAASFLLCLCGAAALALLAYLIWVAMEPPCRRSNGMHRSFHLALRYINGPPPT